MTPSCLKEDIPVQGTLPILVVSLMNFHSSTPRQDQVEVTAREGQSQGEPTIYHQVSSSNHLSDSKLDGHQIISDLLQLDKTSLVLLAQHGICSSWAVT